MLNRRDLIKRGHGAGAGLALALGAALLLAASPAAMGAQTPQLPLAGSAIPQFVNQLPLLSVVGGPIQTVAGNTNVTVHMCEFQAKVLPAGAVAGYTGTWVWGYLPEITLEPPQGTPPPGLTLTNCTDLVNYYSGGTGILETFTGPVILNTRGTPTSLTWINDLPNVAATNVLAWKYSTDQTLHWADPFGILTLSLPEANDCNHMAMFPDPTSPCAWNYGETAPGVFGPLSVPAVIHLHGGEVPPELDGGPDAWVTSDGSKTGHGYYTYAGAPANGAIYKYANTQEAAPIWFHDHALGITRLNVYAGLAGAI